MNKFESLLSDIMDLFHGLMDQSINYSFDKLDCVMGTDICEIFGSVAEEVVLNIHSGNEITQEQLLSLRDNLISFAEEFEVKEAVILAKKVDKLIEK